MLLDLTLEQMFGIGASQDSEKLIIQKASFPALTATSNNRAEQLFVALILHAHQVFEGILTDENDQPITDEYGNPFTYDNRDFFEKITLSFWKTQFDRKNEQDYLLNTFVLDAFVNPPTESGTPLNPDSLNY